MKTRNGKIDLLRFLFAIVIMLHHLGMRTDLFDFMGLHFQVINQGGFAVVFFFLTSGCLLAKSAKKVPVDADIPQSTTAYLWKRYKYFMVWYIPAFILDTIWDWMKYGFVEAMKQAVYNIPGFFMLQRIGFYGEAVYPNGYYVQQAWYLSALMICSLVIYPLLLWKRDLFIRVIAPLISILSLYVLLNIKGNFRTTEGLWYPFAVMCMGCIICEVSEYIGGIIAIQKYSLLLKIIEMCIYLLAFIYICSDLPVLFEYPMFLLLSGAVALSFSGITNIEWFNNKFFIFLGKVSFPLYMLHSSIGAIYWKIIEKANIKYDNFRAHLILYVICIVTAIVAQIVYDNRKKSKV